MIKTNVSKVGLGKWQIQPYESVRQEFIISRNKSERDQ